MILLALFPSCGKEGEDPVSEISVERVTLSATSVSLETGETVQLEAAVFPEDATDPSVKWASSVISVASVSGGLVTALSAGETVITATAGSISATCRVTVKAPEPPVVDVRAVTLDRKSRLLPLGSGFSLQATVMPADATEPSVEWTTSDEAVATVADGVVTPVAEGTAWITAQAGDHQARCLVTVVPEGPSAHEIWYVSWTKAALKFGDAAGCGAALVSNTYADGKGVLLFDGDVTAVSSTFFSGNVGLRAVYLPETVKAIDYQAFKNCSTLLGIWFQEGVTEIVGDAFRGCASLRKVALPSTLESLGTNVFRDCGLIDRLVIPEHVTSLGDFSLYGLNALTSLTFLSDTPPALGFRALDGTAGCPVYVPSASLPDYQADPDWKEYTSRLQGLE